MNTYKYWVGSLLLLLTITGTLPAVPRYYRCNGKGPEKSFTCGIFNNFEGLPDCSNITKAKG